VLGGRGRHHRVSLARGFVVYADLSLVMCHPRRYDNPLCHGMGLCRDGNFGGNNGDCRACTEIGSEKIGRRTGTMCGRVSGRSRCIRVRNCFWTYGGYGLRLKASVGKQDNTGEEEVGDSHVGRK
jgi:hypothetical protein